MGILVATVVGGLIAPDWCSKGMELLRRSCGKAFLKQRERNKLIEQRRADGQCIHCGELADENLGVCMNCGNDPDPSANQLSRVAAMVRGAAQSDRARAVIQGEKLAQIAAKKEKYLVTNRPRKSTGRKK